MIRVDRLTVYPAESWAPRVRTRPRVHSLAKGMTRKGSPPGRAICESGVGSNGRFFAIFRPISRRNSETVQDTTKVTIEY